MNAKTLEGKGFVASDADVKALASGIIGSGDAVLAGRGFYLSALLATTQHAIGEPIKKRRAGRIDADTIKEQIAALLATHERFYAIVLSVAEKSVPADAKERPIAINRKTNFARTALYSLRTYVKAGNDLLPLVPASTTKLMLTVVRTPKPVSAKRLRSRVEKQSATVLASVAALGAVDASAAINDLMLLKAQLDDELAKLRAAAPKARGKPHVFNPTETHVARQMANPS
jgi:hypothetical protein